MQDCGLFHAFPESPPDPDHNTVLIRPKPPLNISLDLLPSLTIASRYMTGTDMIAISQPICSAQIRGTPMISSSGITDIANIPPFSGFAHRSRLKTAVSALGTEAGAASSV